MLDRNSRQRPQAGQHLRPPARGVRVALVAAALIAALGATALASSPSTTVGSAKNAKFAEGNVVDVHGRTLYALSPETTHHLLCKTSECLRFWPPLTVRSRTTKLVAGTGVHGHLAILRRTNGVLQVTLGGRPLYHYSGDHAKGSAKGEDLQSFGGTWHVISAAKDVPLEPAMSETTTTTAPAAPAPPAVKYVY